LFDSKQFSQVFRVRFDKILFSRNIYKKKKTFRRKRKEKAKEKKSFEERSLGLLPIQLGVSKTSNYQNIDDGVETCCRQFSIVVQ